MSFELGQTLYRARVEGSYVRYEEFRVVRPTPAGGWVVSKRNYRGALKAQKDFPYEDGADELRWTSHDGRYCSPTKEQAVQRLKARTRSWVKHARHNLRRAEERAAVLELTIKEMPLLRTFSFFERD